MCYSFMSKLYMSNCHYEKNMTLQVEVSQNSTRAYCSSKTKKYFNLTILICIISVKIQCIVALSLIYCKTFSVIVFNRLRLFHEITQWSLSKCGEELTWLQVVLSLPLSAHSLLCQIDKHTKLISGEESTVTMLDMFLDDDKTLQILYFLYCISDRRD